MEGKVTVITGGAKGIGKAIVKAFHGQGAHVAFIDRDEASGKILQEELGEERVYFFLGDVGIEEDLREFHRAVHSRFGSIHFLIHNACYSKKGLLSGCSYEEFNEVLRVGVTAPYYLTMLFKGAFSEGASVVNISSTRASMSQRDTESYSAAKGGIAALTHAMAMSLSGIARVNSIAPGWIDTTEEKHHAMEDELQHPSRRVGVPEDIARTVLFLCEEKADFINGENITVDGGMSKRMIYHGDEEWVYEKGEL